MEAENLLAAVFPDQLACLENIAGDREIPDHPLVRQTLDDCLTEAMDIEGLEALRHEYVHTVTLEQTRNRIPHWFTEALATYLETKPRTFDTAQLLAAAFDGGTLFDLDAINWAFIRPKKKTDRSQAYAQGAWMVEFIERTWGRDAIVKLLAAYRDGTPERESSWFSPGNRTMTTGLRR